LEGTVPEWGSYAGSGDTSSSSHCGSSSSRDGGTKLIYRHYATLYFVFAVDSQESDLGILDLIQVFVEALDKCFSNVCELDLIFHSDKVHYVLDEIVMGGMVLETNIVAILQSINDQSKMHSQSIASASAGGGGGHGGDGSGAGGSGPAYSDANTNYRDR
jgi:AP-3 complex subunit sigma